MTSTHSTDFMEGESAEKQWEGPQQNKDLDSEPLEASAAVVACGLDTAPTQRFKNSHGNGNDEKKTTDDKMGGNGHERKQAPILRNSGQQAPKKDNKLSVSFSTDLPASDVEFSATSQAMSEISTTSHSIDDSIRMPLSTGRPKHPADDQETHYSLKDLLDSTKEGVDEAAVFHTIETGGNVIKKEIEDNMLPRVPDDLLLNLHANERLKKELVSDGVAGNNSGDPVLKRTLLRRNKSDGDSSDLVDLTRRLAMMPGVQRWENAAKELSGHEYNAKSENDSDDDGEAPATLTRTGLDRYYQNAALIFPTKRTPTKKQLSDQSSERDVESAVFGRGDSGIDARTEDPDAIKKTKKMNALQRMRETRRRAKVDFGFFVEFMQPHKKSLWRHGCHVVCYIILPCLIMAGLLFYVFDNPPVGYALIPCSSLTTPPGNGGGASLPFGGGQFRSPTAAPTPSTPVPDPMLTMGENATLPLWLSESPSAAPTRQPTYSIFDREVPLCIDEGKTLKEASVSWGFLFVARQVMTLSLAIFLQLIVIDFLTLRTRIFPKVMGTRLSLALAQSKGWPFVLFMWALLDLCFLFGPRRIARHWLYWQNLIDLMNATNPSGDVTNNSIYSRMLYVAVGLSVAVTIKRTVMGNFVGKRVVVNYRQDLSKVVKKCLLVSEVAALASIPHRVSERKTATQRFGSFGEMYVNPLQKKFSLPAEESDDEVDLMGETIENFTPIRRSTISKSASPSSSSIESTIAEMLDEWEEPELEDSTGQAVTTTDVLYFRRALGFIDSSMPFSPSFGPASTREECIRSAQVVFEKLQKGRRHVINFKHLCAIAENDDGSLDKIKSRELMKVFRPNRLGEISKLDFIKSTDSVYKQLRLLLANIRNSSQIDNAYEKIVNTVFYVVAGFVVLAAFGLDINSIFILLSSILVSFAFMIGSASSKYLEGILLILVRKPYNIGDRVVFLDPNATVDTDGPPAGGWVVEKVDLYTTSVRLGTTREYSTFANGSLAGSRIINLKRSDKPNVFIKLKFTTNVTKDMLDAFYMEMANFINDRPREWIRINGFRCTRVETEQQYMEYQLIVQHRESWQSFSTIQDSKGYVLIHSMKIQKEMGMQYIAPKVPIEMVGGNNRSIFNTWLGSPSDFNVPDDAGHETQDKNKLV